MANSSTIESPEVAEQSAAGVEAFTRPRRGTGLRKRMIYIMGFVGAVVILGILSIASQQQHNSHPVVETPLVFGKSEMAQGTPAGKLQSGYGGYDPSTIGDSRGYADPSPPQKPTTASNSDDAELERLRMEMARLQMEQQQGMQSKSLANYETAMNSPLLFKNAPVVRPASLGLSDRINDGSGVAPTPETSTVILDAPLPSRMRANAQDEKTRFLTEAAQVEPYLRKPLVEPVSDFELKAGSFIPAALITAINSDLPGDVIAQVSQNVFDTRSGAYLLIPQGTRILGKYQSLVSNGQNRALIVWTRLVMPNGNSIVLDGMPGTDQTGAAGAEDQVDYHLDKLAAAATLSTAIAYGGNLARDDGSGQDERDVIGDTVAQQASRIGGKIIDRQLDVQPTIKIRQGYPLNVLVNKDMIFR